MRTDDTLVERPDSDRVEAETLAGISRLVGLTDPRLLAGASLSGGERNRLFLNRGGRGFEDASALSGLDHPGDGRAAAMLDFDRDGWLDFAVVNANAPLLQLFRNGAGALPGADALPRGVLAVRLVGANRTDRPAPGRSNRDGVGAVFEVEAGGARLLREQRAGEGFAAQNSATQLVGLGPARRAERLRVRWPSGREQQREGVPAGSLVTVYEDPEQSPDGSGFAVEPYHRQVVLPHSAPAPALRLVVSNADGGARLRLLNTMATWCEVCRGELPQLAALRRAFPPEQVALFGVPVDEGDDAAALEAYRREHAPAYELLEPLSPAQREEVARVVRAALAVDALPATIVTDARGGVLRTLGRVPSVSEVRRWLDGGA